LKGPRGVGGREMQISSYVVHQCAKDPVATAPGERGGMGPKVADARPQSTSGGPSGTRCLRQERTLQNLRARVVKFQAEDEGRACKALGIIRTRGSYVELGKKGIARTDIAVPSHRTRDARRRGHRSATKGRNGMPNAEVFTVGQTAMHRAARRETRRDDIETASTSGGEADRHQHKN